MLIRILKLLLASVLLLVALVVALVCLSSLDSANRIMTFAVFASPVFALIVGNMLQSRKERRVKQYEIFSTLMQFRAEPVHREFVRALNSIDFEFKDSPNVTDSWTECFKAFEEVRSNPDVDLTTSINDLLFAISSHLKLGLTKDKIERAYRPQVAKTVEDLQLRYLVGANRFFQGDIKVPVVLSSDMPPCSTESFCNTNN